MSVYAKESALILNPFLKRFSLLDLATSRLNSELCTVLEWRRISHKSSVW